MSEKPNPINTQQDHEFFSLVVRKRIFSMESQHGDSLSDKPIETMAVINMRAFGVALNGKRIFNEDKELGAVLMHEAIDLAHVAYALFEKGTAMALKEEKKKETKT